MKKTDALIILDGFGYGEKNDSNAIEVAGIPNFKKLWDSCPHTFINASGLSVGLPDGQMGNSEVGHLNLGAGRVIYQDITRIDRAINDGSFFANEQFNGAIDNAISNGTYLHIAGLLGNGGVHSSINHLFALLELCRRRGLKKVYVHAITDGRDTAPDSALGFVQILEDKIKELGVGKIATVTGRYYYMDRDNRWERVEAAYRCVFEGQGAKFASATEAIKASYAADKRDEFIEPCIIGDYDGVKDGDSYIFYNFRSDRAREMSHVLLDDDFNSFARDKKDIFYVGMTEYDASLDMRIAFGPKEIKNTLGEYVSAKGLNQTRVAETEKYAHVTFFFNGGVEKPNDNEDRILVPSPKVATYDLKPEMSAYEVTDKALSVVGKTDLLIMNYANCDMVGHTGILDAAVSAVKAVDECFIKVVTAVVKTGGCVIVTADHGNAECMKVGVKPMTAHTTNPVPLVIAGDKVKGKELMGGALCDVAPTLLTLMGLPIPSEMEGKSLIK
ncbi:MAG: 2,3-bisphosphoglycerate-independent phosphoglycerate mutase [Clostridiales bacterium]|nr:2,3-bisphosphoglycerate-independent phosphoglycerate mutase [Clostridiales bacterium]